MKILFSLIGLACMLTMAPLPGGAAPDEAPTKSAKGAKKKAGKKAFSPELKKPWASFLHLPQAPQPQGGVLHLPAIRLPVPQLQL